MPAPRRPWRRRGRPRRPAPITSSSPARRAKPPRSPCCAKPGDVDAHRAPASAARWYAAALRLMPEASRPERLNALIKLARVQQSTGHLERCIATLLEALELVPADEIGAPRQAHVRVRGVRALPRAPPAGGAAPARGLRRAAGSALRRGGGRAAGPRHRRVLHRRQRTGCATSPSKPSPAPARSPGPGCWRPPRPWPRTAARSPGGSPALARTPTRPARCSTHRGR